MVVTIHQPEHFPYMGYFQKMEKADLFVILDNVNYRKNYFQNRNRFLNNNGVEEWFTIPVEKEATNKWIKDVRVNTQLPWRKKLITKLQQNFKTDFTEIYNSDSLTKINMNSVRWAMKQLNLNTEIVFASELDVYGDKSELLANICKKLNATTYLSGPSGKDYLDLSYFNNIKIQYHNPVVDNPYSCIYNILK